MAADESTSNGWNLASQSAARILPRILRPDPTDPTAFVLNLPVEYNKEQQFPLVSLTHNVFTAPDSTGWIYQYWQSKTEGAFKTSRDS